MTVVFGAFYMSDLGAPATRPQRLRRPPSTASSLTYLVVLLALAGVMIATLGQAGTASLVYCAVAAVMIFPLRVAAASLVLALVGLVLLLDAAEPRVVRARSSLLSRSSRRRWRCSASGR